MNPDINIYSLSTNETTNQDNYYKFIMVSFTKNLPLRYHYVESYQITLIMKLNTIMALRRQIILADYRSRIRM